jgi:hypothetical protein
MNFRHKQTSLAVSQGDALFGHDCRWAGSFGRSASSESQTLLDFPVKLLNKSGLHLSGREVAKRSVAILPKQLLLIETFQDETAGSGDRLPCPVQNFMHNPTVDIGQAAIAAGTPIRAATPGPGQTEPEGNRRGPAPIVSRPVSVPVLVLDFSVTARRSPDLQPANHEPCFHCIFRIRASSHHFASCG